MDSIFIFIFPPLCSSPKQKHMDTKIYVSEDEEFRGTLFTISLIFCVFVIVRL